MGLQEGHNWVTEHILTTAMISSSQPYSNKVFSEVSKWNIKSLSWIPFTHMPQLFIQITWGPWWKISRDVEGKGTQMNRGNPIHFQNVMCSRISHIKLNLVFLEHPYLFCPCTARDESNFSWYDVLSNIWMKSIIFLLATIPWCLSDPS